MSDALQAKGCPHGSAVLIQDWRCSGFILLKKIDPTPGSVFDGKYSLFGGRCRPGENSEQTLERELREEWQDRTLIADVMRRAFAVKPMVLPAREWGGSYVFHPYVASATSEEHFKDWLTILLEEGAVKEGRAVYLSRHQLLEEINSPEKFLAGLEMMIRRHFDLLMRSDQRIRMI
ncbi:NUDIX domain-containing protein [Candidatus Uhrbacteria bacterium]|nr:NUDIX domain-containing protein [Candidatus Uhrbacteria bacterium]